MQYNTAKSYFLKAIVLLLSVVIFSQSGIAEENIPLLPMTVQGVVLEAKHGSPAPEGTIITAYIDGKVIEETSAGSSGNYCLWISGITAARYSENSTAVSKLGGANGGFGGIIPSMGPISMVIQNEFTPSGGEFLSIVLTPHLLTLFKIKAIWFQERHTGSL